MSLLDIMREQEDEALAKKLHKQYACYSHNCGLEVPSNLDFEQQLLLAQELSQQEFQNSEHRTQLDNELETLEAEELAKKFQELEYDKSLATYLQIEERISYGKEISERGLTDFETNMYKLKFRENEEENEDREFPVDESNSEFQYDEPYELYGPSHEHEIEPQILYDHSQREVDQEIGHVYRRDIEKRNSTAVPMHHKIYSTRNKGKFKDDGLFMVNENAPKSQRGKKRQNQTNNSNKKNKPKNKDISLGFPIKTANQEYGQVVLLPGAAHCQIMDFTNGSIKFCRIGGTIKKKRPMELWDTVLLSTRDFQPSRGDVIYVYSGQEKEKLVEINHLISFDPLTNLTPDCLFTLFAFFDQNWLHKVGKRISTKWFIFISHLVCDKNKHM